jgi:hypothetical protein
MYYHKKKHHHSLFITAIGRKEKDWTSCMKICNAYGTKNVSYTKKYVQRGNEVKLDYSFDIPNGDGMSKMKNIKAGRTDIDYDCSLI